MSSSSWLELSKVRLKVNLLLKVSTVNLIIPGDPQQSLKKSRRITVGEDKKIKVNTKNAPTLEEAKALAAQS